MIKVDIFTGQVAGCNMCIHKLDFGCRAFPNGIPIPFSSGEFLHDTPVTGDNGIVFTPPFGTVFVEIQNK